MPHRQQFSHVLAVLYRVDPRCMFANATLELEVLISVAALVGLLLAGMVLLVALPLGLRLAGPTLCGTRVGGVVVSLRRWHYLSERAEHIAARLVSITAAAC